MADRTKKITDLPELTVADGNNVILVIDNIDTTANTKQITLNNLFSNYGDDISANSFLIKYNSTPANSTVTVTQGSIFFDSNYLYVAVANNTLKRVSLSTF